jgi:hypothetical protein
MSEGSTVSEVPVKSGAQESLQPRFRFPSLSTFGEKLRHRFFDRSRDRIQRVEEPASQIQSPVLDIPQVIVSPEEPESTPSNPPVKDLEDIYSAQSSADFSKLSNSDLLAELDTTISRLDFSSDPDLLGFQELFKKSLNQENRDIKLSVETVVDVIMGADIPSEIRNKLSLLVETINQRSGLIHQKNESKVDSSLPDNAEYRTQFPKSKEIERNATYRYEDRSWVEVTEKLSSQEISNPCGFLENRGKLPTNCQSWKRSNTKVIVNNQQLEHLPEGVNYSIQLDELEILPLNGQKEPNTILLGTIINSDLTTYLQRALGFSTQQNIDSQRLANGELHPLEELFFKSVNMNLSAGERKRLIKPKSIWPILTASNGRGKDRVYYADAGRINGKRLILTIAACGKSDQHDTLTTVSHIVT